jgi:acetylornithine aminotransferase
LEAIPFERIGGLVFELGGGSSLVRFPPKQLIQTLARKVRQHCGLVIANEVTAGLGRTGTWYGFQHYDLQPDIVTLGKGLGNGYPVSAVAVAREVADELENSALHYAQSHENDPLGCVIAKEVIRVIREDDLVSRSEQMGALFVRELGHLAERHTRIKEVRGRGLMIAVEFETQDARFSVTSVYRGLVKRGFLVGYSSTANLLRFDPALIIGKEDVAQLVQSLDHILEGLR